MSRLQTCFFLCPSDPLNDRSGEVFLPTSKNAHPIQPDHELPIDIKLVLFPIIPQKLLTSGGPLSSLSPQKGL